MPPEVVALPPSAAFWDEVAQALLVRAQPDYRMAASVDLSSVRVMVSTFEHIQLLRQALTRALDRAFIPPTIMTLGAAIGMLPPASGIFATASSERLMTLYASLRQHAWLKKLFTARRNTDLLPLAETLLALSDELTQALLPSLHVRPDAADARWQAALEQLSPSARHMVSDEAQLVQTIWKSQLDGNDAIVLRFVRMLAFADQATQPLFWISPVAPDPMEQAFLDAWAGRQAVTIFTLRWDAEGLAEAYCRAWSEVLDIPVLAASRPIGTPQGVSLFPAQSMEAEAQGGAQVIVDWLQQGKQQIAIVAQDRVVARRIRALLDRAQIQVADETGWKLSTTRAAAAIAAWLELIAASAETMALLDFLKSPFVMASAPGKADVLMKIELVLRRANVLSGWEAANKALADQPEARELIASLAQQAAQFSKPRTLCAWLGAMHAMLDALDMRTALQADEAGAQVLTMFSEIERDCVRVEQPFSFAEWRAFLNLQLESTAFVARNHDRRVIMLPLNGARLRTFDAVLVVGADGEHLPSRPVETLFFANSVRAELGLPTREQRQRQQLRDVIELLSSNDTVLLSWQMHKNGEPNPASPWIERLKLTLQQAGQASLPIHDVTLAKRHLDVMPVTMPRPAAPTLVPRRLSASGYNSLVACPYQFFATRMLGLSGIDELSDMPEKRDYGDWLHQILLQFHETLRDRTIPLADRPALLEAISNRVFAQELDRSAAALGYYARWQKNMSAYLAWVEKHEADGWTFSVGEERLERVLRWHDGEVLLHGRVDRIDHNADGQRMVLDYKSTGQSNLKNRLKLGEDQQLPFYGLLSHDSLASAAYVPLEADKNGIALVETAELDQWQQVLSSHITDNMQAIANGAPLPATGPESVCQYCDVRGLCRKGAW
ncbi:MAG: PD-(D/E)XK nuclease family protein [Oxalicibacterium faecigallinarum]|uniref:PD-(D/E)XK nuclease family protein n=1 Tax=Oxalicibacterium faecigallinarum TaxID=573741 RepID=UPI002809AB71|nr:PD-(D/E)XK nuclease family protein [Oxalicibacterium faecigallinarum]MDQ7970587.1 PD-(D/E)XK nuclease family protein [Oxalicibacterium faecigallinarum]